MKYFVTQTAIGVPVFITLDTVATDIMNTNQDEHAIDIFPTWEIHSTESVERLTRLIEQALIKIAGHAFSLTLQSPITNLGN